MMSIGNISSSSGYYENAPEKSYSLDEKLQSKFIGEGAKELGLYGKEVLPIEQQILMKGILPTGETKIRFEQSGRTGYDLTFSAPKSVSVLGLVVGDTRLIDAHKNAVEMTIKEIEKLASVRIKNNENYQINHTGNLVVALHTHDTSRALDPQLHTHALVFNMTKNNQGEYQSLSSDKANKTGFSEALFSNQVSFGVIYNQILKRSVEALGFETMVTGKNGLWEIQGVPTEEYSTRGKQIKAIGGDNATAKEKSLIALKTRPDKQPNIDRNELQQNWQKRLNDTGFNQEKFYQNLKPKSQSQTNQFESQIVNSEAVVKAILNLSGNKVQLGYQEIFNESLKYSSNSYNVVTEIKQGIEEAVKENIIIPTDKNQSLFVSSVNIEKEKEIIALSGNINSKTIKSEGDNFHYSDDKGINLFFNSSSPIGILTGKQNQSTVIKNLFELNRVAKINGLEPIIVTSSGKTQKNLASNDINNTLSFTKLDDASIRENTLLIVPQAEGLSLDRAKNILSIASEKQSKIVFLNSAGMTGQGNAIDVMKKNNINEFYFDQKLGHINIQIDTVANKKLRLEKMVNHYMNNKSHESSIITTDNKKDKAQLTTLIRHKLKETGEVEKTGITIKTLVPVYTTSITKSEISTYKKGMILETWRDKKVVQYEIVSLDKQRNLLYMKNGQQSEVLRLKDIDNKWNVFDTRDIEVSKGDKLISLGAMFNGKIKANNSLTVQKTNSNGFTVINESGQKFNFSNSNKAKMDYDYVSGFSQIGKKDGIVYLSLDIKSLNENSLNQAALLGSNIRLYSPMSLERTEQKIGQFTQIKTTIAQLKGDEYLDVNDAISGRKEKIFNEVEKAVNIGINISQGSNVFFSINNVVSEALKSNNKININEINTEIQKRIKTGDIIFLHNANGIGNSIGISKETFEQEKSIQTHILNGINNSEPLLTSEQLKKADLSHLTDGQQKATELILTSRDKFIGIQGLAGVGKTTQLKTVLAQIKEHQPEVEIIGLAPTHKAVFEMKQIGINAQTISSFLVDVKKEMQVNENLPLDGKIFLIDESSMIGNKNTAELYDIISRSSSRGIFSGDVKQLLSIDSGSSFALLQNNTSMKFAVMSEIVRQNEQLKPAVEALLNNQIKNALDIANQVDPNNISRDKPFVALNNVIDSQLVKQGGYESIVDYIAKDYSSRDQKARDNTLVVTQLNQDKNIINQAIHDELRKSGKIDKNETIVPILSNVNISEHELSRLDGYKGKEQHILSVDKEYYLIEGVNKDDNTLLLTHLDSSEKVLFSPSHLGNYSDIALYKQELITISEKDKLMITKTNENKGFIANSEWIVASINQSEISLVDKNGNHQSIDLKANDERHFNLGYATTDYGAQGASFDFVIAYNKSDANNASWRSFYVTITRGKEHVTFATDNLPEFLKNIEIVEDRFTATDLLNNNDAMKTMDYENTSKIENEIISTIAKIISDYSLEENIESIKNAININELSHLSLESIKDKILDELMLLSRHESEGNDISLVSHQIEQNEEKTLDEKKLDEKDVMAHEFIDKLKGDGVIASLQRDEMNINVEAVKDIGEKTL